MERPKWFPTGKERKEYIQSKREKINDVVQDPDAAAIFRKDYDLLDSPLDNYSDTFTRDSFFTTFKDVLPAGETSMVTYIERTLAEKKGSALGIEFGGIGVRAFNGFTPGFFKESFGVTLVDHRTIPEVARDAAIEADRNHHILVADMLRTDLYQQLENRLQGQKIDLILERVAGGMSFIPAEPNLLTGMFQHWYAMLNTNGLIFCQTPQRLNPLLEAWITHVDQTYPGRFEISFHPQTYNWSTLRLLKRPGAPEQLPLLDPRVVRAIGRRTEEQNNSTPS